MAIFDVKSWVGRLSRNVFGFDKLFGEDIFIAYSRKDGAVYALSLAEQLRRLGFSCVLDQLIGSGADLPERLIRLLRRSRMLVVIVTEGATNSPSVHREVEEFIKTKRVVIPVSVEGTLEKAQWSYLLTGVAAENERAEAISLGDPSPIVIQRIAKSFEYTKRSVRQRNSIWAYALALALLTGFYFLFFTTELRQSSPFLWLAAITGFAMSFFFDLLYPRFARFGSLNMDWFYERVTLSKFYRRRALRDYKQALLKQSSRLILAFKSRGTSAQREVYVPLKLHAAEPTRMLNPFSALLEYKRLVILGVPGSGKTTLLWFITQTFAEGGFHDLPDEPAPVLIEISKLQRPGRDLTKSISDVLRGSDFPEGDTFKRYLMQGKLILLFDGLDEVNAEDRQAWVRSILDLVAAHPSCRFIVTCRPASYHGEFEAVGARALTIAELDDQQVREFLILHFKQTSWPAKTQTLLPEAAAEQFMTMLRQSPRIFAIARTPLLLNLIVILYLNTGQLSLTRSAVDFYQQAVDTLLRGWTNEQNHFSPAEKRAVLQEIALFINDGGSLAGNHSIEYDKAVELARGIFKSRRSSDDSTAQWILDEIAERSNLLVRFDESRYSFWHLTFQEFFTAERLISEPNLLLTRYTNDQVGWREVVKLWCGMALDASQLIRKLYLFDPVFALECLGDARQVDSGVAHDIIGFAKNSFCNQNGDEAAAERAFGSLAGSGHTFSRDVFSFLEGQLETADEIGCRMKAARALAHTQSPTAAEVIAGHYADLADVRPILAGMGDAAVPAFVRLVQENEDGSAQALEDLRAIGTKAAREALSALVPLLGERVESLKQQKPLLRIEFAGRTGFHINRDETMRLRVTNIGTQLFKDVPVELEDTSKYTVNTPSDRRAVKIERLGVRESQEVQFPIRVTQPGLITLQLRVSGGIYKDALLEITAVHDNPYYFGPPVSSAHNFFGRGSELQASLDNTMSPEGAHTMIVGEQRSGKTSLLFQIRDRLTPPYVPVYISFSGIEREGKSALSWLLHRIVEELKNRGELEGKNYSTSLEFGSDFTARLAKIMEGLKEGESDRRLVLLLDEAHLMNKIGEQFQEVLRETFAQFVEGVRVLIACYYDFFDDLRASSSPLHNIFEFLFLKPFGGDDLRRLIVEPGRRFGFEYEEAAIEAVTDVGGGHPYYCQYLCARSYREAEKEGRTTITCLHVEAARQHVLSNDKQKFQIGYWDNLRPEERLFLKQLVSSESTKNVSRDVVNRLVNKFIVKESRGMYVFTASLFEDWVRQLVHEQM